MPTIYFAPDDREVEVESGSVLEAALGAGVPHINACGGKARCSTCRVHVDAGLDTLGPRSEAEAGIASRLRLEPAVRLACQARVGDAPVRVRRLVLDDVDCADAIAANKAGERAGSLRSTAILFADVRGFTTFSESLPAHDVVHVLNRYFAFIGRPITANGGRIDNYMGDGIMALFGLAAPIDAPIALADIALGAARAGLGMIAAMDPFNEYLESAYGMTLRIGVGIHVGDVVVGDLGAPGSRRCTAIGDAVNVASRVESSNKALETEFLVSEATRDLLGDRVTIGKSGEIALKGKTGAFKLFEVTDVA